MILVDTSVWIRFLTNRSPYAAELDRLMDSGEVAGHDLVHGELLIGNRGGRADLMRFYSMLPHIPSARHPEIVDFVKTYKLHGRGIGWIDAHLLYSALVNGVTLWTADQRLDELAKDAGVSYTPTGFSRSREPMPSQPF